MADGLLDEKWIKWVAATTTLLAVCAAISSLKGGSYSTKIQILTTQESNKWSYFQAKSIKQHTCEIERDLLLVQQTTATDAAVKTLVAAKLKEVEDNIARYDKEKAGIQEEAKQLSKDQVELKGHGGNFGQAVMFFQIAIMLSSVGALMKKKFSWILGLATGAFGLVYFVNGFVQFF
jgi:hypothetical protein